MYLEGVDANARLSRVMFANPANGWVFGETGVVFATTDGGVTWREVSRQLGVSRPRAAAHPTPELMLIVGDWGTGIPRARRVANLIRTCLDGGRRAGLERRRPGGGREALRAERDPRAARALVLRAALAATRGSVAAELV